jgi:pimeloyl-ACP methyl ester carboxylesterase
VSSLHDLPGLHQSLEILWIEPGTVRSSSQRASPTLVFLHEGLGSISQWRNFPQALCNLTGLRGLLYARQGYGQSSLRAQAARSDFMHIEAQQVLPALLESLSITRPILIGHSDGASIALLYGAWAERNALRAGSERRGSESAASPVPGSPLRESPLPAALTYPSTPLALCVLAPHLFVEEAGVRSIAQARTLFDEDSSFRERLGKHHRNVEQTFDNWANVWLSEDFKTWNIEAALADINCPILAIQGCDDQYGSLAQIRRIPELVNDPRQVELVKIPNCKHSPHLEKQAEVLSACERFIGQFL